MKTSTVLTAITKLEEASKALAHGDLSIAAQVALSTECFKAAYTLRSELEKDVPTVPVMTERGIE